MQAAAIPAPILHLQQLGITYPGGVVALRPTNLTFRQGELTVLLGLSGAGKSSLLRSLNHLVQPSEGAIESVRHGVLKAGAVLRAHRRDTAMVFQHHQLLGRQTALQNVLTGRLAYHGFWRSLWPLPEDDIAIAARALARVQLEDKLFVRADQLSGGQQQRVGIARALAQQPSMILADEPVASLDPSTTEKILDLLKGICTENNITAVVSLHQLEYARRFADRIIGLANASVVFDGSPRDLNQQSLELIYSNPDPQAKSKDNQNTSPSFNCKPATEIS